MSEAGSVGPDASTGASDAAGEAAARVLAFYLPQFHPMPENDHWWGPGFTEWTNVAAARKRYPTHYQPHLPGELGFYDLRLDETRADQAELARTHGVSGFCFWHYWFAGRRVLNEVVDRVLDSGVPDFPFCLGWANESWSDKRSLGAQDRLLIEQTYPGDDDDRKHFDAITPILHDPRYVHVDGRPVFVVYRPMLLPDAARFAELWRTLADEAGLPGLYLIGQSFIDGRTWSARAAGFDAVAPWYFPPRAHRWQVEPKYTTPDIVLTELTRRLKVVPSVFWQEHWNDFIPWMIDGERCFPSVLPNWDNTPRMGRSGVVLHGSTPELFGRQVRKALDLVAGRPADERVVFVRSWNEWAEGNHLEPDRRHGRGFLEVLRDELERARPGGD